MDLLDAWYAGKAFGDVPLGHAGIRREACEDVRLHGAVQLRPVQHGLEAGDDARVQQPFEALLDGAPGHVQAPCQAADVGPAIRLQGLDESLVQFVHGWQNDGESA